MPGKALGFFTNTTPSSERAHKEGIAVHIQQVRELSPSRWLSRWQSWDRIQNVTLVLACATSVLSPTGTPPAPHTALCLEKQEPSWA